MSDLAAFVEQGWADHADAPAAVAARMPDGLPLLRSEADVAALARLAEHVWGAHLGQWTAGLQFMMRLSDRAGRVGLLSTGGEAETSLERLAGVLALCKGQRDPRPGLALSEQVRIAAMAAANLGLFDAARAKVLLGQALQQAADAGLPDADPMHRTLAVCGNNLALALEELAERSDEQRALMITAAETGRCYWEKAGDWVHVERAAYRLACTWLKAGDPQQARWHAASCVQIVQQHGDVALESFFGHEVLARAEHARGDADAALAALARMRLDFDRLDADDRAACQEALDAVQRRLGMVQQDGVA